MVKLSNLSLLLSLIGVNGVNIFCDGGYEYLREKYVPGGVPEDTDYVRIGYSSCDMLQNIFKETDLNIQVSCSRFNTNFKCDTNNLIVVNMADMGITGRLDLSNLGNLISLNLNDSLLYGNSTIQEGKANIIKFTPGNRCTIQHNFLNCDPPTTTTTPTPSPPEPTPTPSPPEPTPTPSPPEPTPTPSPPEPTPTPESSGGVITLFMFILSIGLYFFSKNVWISLGVILIAIIYYFSFRNKDKRD